MSNTRHVDVLREKMQEALGGSTLSDMQEKKYSPPGVTELVTQDHPELQTQDETEIIAQEATENPPERVSELHPGDDALPELQTQFVTQDITQQHITQQGAQHVTKKDTGGVTEGDTENASGVYKTDTPEAYILSQLSGRKLQVLSYLLTLSKGAPSCKICYKEVAQSLEIPMASFKQVMIRLQRAGFFEKRQREPLAGKFVVPIIFNSRHCGQAISAFQIDVAQHVTEDVTDLETQRVAHIHPSTLSVTSSSGPYKYNILEKKEGKTSPSVQERNESPLPKISSQDDDDLAEDYPLLTQAGLNQGHIERLVRQWEKRGEEMNFPALYKSLDYAEYALEHGLMDQMSKSGRVEDPVAYWFQSVKKTGTFRRPKGYLSPAELQARAWEEQLREEKDAKKRQDELAFSAWKNSLTPDQKSKILQGKVGPEEPWIKTFWRENVSGS